MDFLSALPAVGSLLSAPGTMYAGRQLRKYLNAAMGELGKGYGEAGNLLGKVGDVATKGYGNLASRYESGEFDPGAASPYDAGEFKFDYKEDPGFQAALNASLGQIRGTAAQSGMAHSPQTTAALMERAGDLTAKHYGDVFNRARGVYESDRGFGAQQQSQAWQQNLARGQNQFNMGQSLYQNPMMQTTMGQANLATELARQRAEIQAKKGGVSAGIAAAPWAAAQGSLNLYPGA